MPRRFTADEFHATRFTSADEKAKVVNDTIRFINADAPEASLSRLLYKAYSLHFGHIAHNDRSGFHFVWFATARKRLNFVEQIADRHPWQGISPDWKDVEAALLTWIDESNILERLCLRAYHEENAVLMATARSALLALTPELRAHVIENLESETAARMTQNTTAHSPSSAATTEPEGEQPSLFAA